MKRNPVLAVMSTLAAMQLILGSSAITDILPKTTVGVLMALVGAAQMGIQFYVRGQVTPYDTVVAQRTDSGVIIAGPAAAAATGAPVIEPEPAPTVSDPQPEAVPAADDTGQSDPPTLLLFSIGVVVGALLFAGLAMLG